jgi:hypothetical protein
MHHNYDVKKREVTQLESHPWKKLPHKDPEKETILHQLPGTASLPEDRFAILRSNPECCKTERERERALTHLED